MVGANGAGAGLSVAVVATRLTKPLDGIGALCPVTALNNVSPGILLNNCCTKPELAGATPV